MAYDGSSPELPHTQSLGTHEIIFRARATNVNEMAASAVLRPSCDRLFALLRMVDTSHLPAVIASRYVPIRLIGKGGMGAVYEVEHARTGERLALKVLRSGVGASAEALERFKREARASARIKSEHVVRVTDADIAPELDGAPFLVMELLDGTDLERAAVTAPPDPATVVHWLRQAARAIDKAHRVGIVHRDLKPENLFVVKVDGGSSIVKVLDFGMVKMVEEGSGATASGQILGTPKYMAPEQASANARVTPATDRYSMGLIAYRLLTGHSYYRGDVMSILGQLLNGPLQPPSERSPGFGSRLDAWFVKACNRNPDERFASAAEQIEALAEALGLPRVPIEATPEMSSRIRSEAEMPTKPAAIVSGTSALVNGSRGSRGLLLTLVLVAALVAAVFAYRDRGRGTLNTTSTAVPFDVPASPASDGQRTASASESPLRLDPPAEIAPPTNASTVGSAAATPPAERGPEEPRSGPRRASDRGRTTRSKKPQTPDPFADQK